MLRADTPIGYLHMSGPSDVFKYEFFTANDISDRDPFSWDLHGSTTPGTGGPWTLIDSRSSYPSSNARLVPFGLANCDVRCAACAGPAQCTACKSSWVLFQGICSDTCLHGYHEVSQVCIDTDECMTSPCTAGSRCVNTIGSFLCLPFVRNAISIPSGATNIAGHFVLDNTAGGQSLSVDIHLGNFTAPGVVEYGPAVSPTLYSCASPSFTPIAGNALRVTCATVAGTGARLHLRVQLCHPQQATLCIRNSNTTASDWFSYPLPVISAATLRLTSQSNGTSHLIIPADSPSVRVTFAGVHLGQASSMSSTVVTYGPDEDITRFSCTLVALSDTALQCDTQPATYGVNLRFQLVSGIGPFAQVVQGIDRFSLFDQRPVLFSVAGCSNMVAQTLDCPTQGGAVLTLRGINFASPLAVLVGGASCAIIGNFTETLIHCGLPAGTGASQQVVISSINQFSAAQPLVSYAAPAVHQLVGCQAVPSSPLRIEACGRLGGQWITGMK